MRMKTRELCLLSVAAALMFILQIVMAPLPNIEPVSLLMIVLTCSFGTKALFSAAVFILLEGLIHGFGLWWFFYLYAWPALIFLVLLVRNTIDESAWGWALVSGGFGLCFGLLYALIFLFTGGFETFISTWIAGFVFDISHCVGNFILCLCLYTPLRKIIKRLERH